MPTEDKTKVIGIVAGVAALGAGLYFYLKGLPKGFRPGESFIVVGSIEHRGVAGRVVQQCALGKIVLGIFDEVEGLKWRADFSVDQDANWRAYPIALGCGPIPIGTKPGTYDAEFSIREDGIVQGQRVLIAGALKVIE